MALFLGAGALIWAMAPRGNPPKVAGASVWDRVAPSVARAPDPTPFFGTFRGARLRLPVPALDVTVLAFHQTWYDDSIPMKPLVPEGDRAAIAREVKLKKKALKEGTAVEPATREEDAPVADEDGVWIGSALHLWRTGRAGAQDTAIDCGAEPGTTVFSPVDGTVMQVRAYKLYKKYADFEIHIKPDAWSDVDFIILHVSDPAVVEGRHVTAGVTPLAKVRRLSSVVSGLQLRTYSTDGGNHCHIQVNRIPKPDEPWVLGQDPPGFKRRD